MAHCKFCFILYIIRYMFYKEFSTDALRKFVCTYVLKLKMYRYSKVPYNFTTYAIDNILKIWSVLKTVSY